MNPASRFYQEVHTVRLASGRCQVLLDAKPAATPGGNTLELPSAALAAAIAGEWQKQGNELRPHTMRLTRLANTAIDRIAPSTRSAVADFLKFAQGDLLCFRASGPDLLVQRQSAVWDPLLDWAGERFGIAFKTVCGIVRFEPPAEDLARLESLVLQ